MKRQITALMQTGLDDEVFMAAEALVAKGGKVLAHVTAGHVLQASRFDLSSLTKPLVIANLFLQLAADGIVDLDETVDDFVSTKTLKNVSLKDLLEHRSGLVAWAQFLPHHLNRKHPAFSKNKHKIIREILDDKIYLSGKPVGTTLYSDLGYMVLGALLERITRKKLSSWYTKKIAKPLRFSENLAYRPLDKYAVTLHNAVVPSGICLQRKRLLQGEVQDTNAYLMGGVSGHAGLFGNALAIHKLLLQWRLAKTGQSLIFSKTSFSLLKKSLATPLKKRQRFIYGYDTLDADSPNFGNCFSRSATLCHLGFSGTSFVWDLSKDVWVILLTNRGMYRLDNPKIYDFRTTFHNLVMKAL